MIGSEYPAQPMPAPRWRATSVPPVEPGRFGRDHWSTLAYLETRIADHRGTINHNYMRCHSLRHPMMAQAKTQGLGGFDASQFPTWLAGGEELPDHDDYDCVDDLIAAGLLKVHMPEPTAGFHDKLYFVDAYDRPITTVTGELIRPASVTDMHELRLCAFATFTLTGKGRRVAAALRAHKAHGGSWSTFWSTFRME